MGAIGFLGVFFLSLSPVSGCGALHQPATSNGKRTGLIFPSGATAEVQLGVNPHWQT